jgi:predicted hydrolase (HD superfamily)
MTLSRESAWALLTEYTQGESLRKHALAVEAALCGYARRFEEDETTWAVVGLLHDFDYGYPEFVIRAILSHAEYSNVPRESKLEHALFACDEMAGFVTASALVRPSKSVLDLEPGSVIKRMKDRAFARAINRDDLRKGAEELAIPLEQHIANVIASLRERADELGLRGSGFGVRS